MSAADLPIPPDIFFDDAPPLSDDDLDRLFAAADLLVDPPEGTSAYSSVADAIAGLAEGEDAPSYPRAQETARWQVDDDRTAAWAASKLAAAEGEVGRLAVQRDEWMERIGAWFDQASRKPRRTAEFMRGHLERYGLAVREETGQATLALPDATVKTTHRKARLEVVDDEVLAGWLEEHRADFAERFFTDGVLDEEAWRRLVRRTAKVYVGEARKVLRVVEVDDGWAVVGVDDEVVPGATVKSAETTATVEVNP